MEEPFVIGFHFPRRHEDRKSTGQPPISVEDKDLKETLGKYPHKAVRELATNLVTC